MKRNTIKRKNNNLVLVNVGDNKYYFTSMSKAGMLVGLAAASVKWAINHNSELYTDNDELVTFEVIDGSEIPYKYINV